MVSGALKVGFPDTFPVPLFLFVVLKCVGKALENNSSHQQEKLNSNWSKMSVSKWWGIDCIFSESFFFFSVSAQSHSGLGITGFNAVISIVRLTTSLSCVLFSTVIFFFFLLRKLFWPFLFWGWKRQTIFEGGGRRKERESNERREEERNTHL